MALRGTRRTGATGEAGFTLVELLIACMLSLVLIGALALMLSSVLRSEPANAERVGQIQEARVGLERAVRELRQGQPVPGVAASSRQLTVDAYTRSTCPGGVASVGDEAVLCRVTYACTEAAGSASCTRRAGTGPVTTVLAGLASADVFSDGVVVEP